VYRGLGLREIRPDARGQFSGIALATNSHDWRKRPKESQRKATIVIVAMTPAAESA